MTPRALMEGGSSNGDPSGELDGRSLRKVGNTQEQGSTMYQQPCIHLACRGHVGVIQLKLGARVPTAWKLHQRREAGKPQRRRRSNLQRGAQMSPRID